MSQVFPYDQQLFEESVQRDYCHSLLRNDAQNEEQIYCVDASISMATANNTSSTATVLTGQTGGERGVRGLRTNAIVWDGCTSCGRHVGAMSEPVRHTHMH